jgi:hypothetical protein
MAEKMRNPHQRKENEKKQQKQKKNNPSCRQTVD